MFHLDPKTVMQTCVFAEMPVADATAADMPTVMQRVAEATADPFAGENFQRALKEHPNGKVRVLVYVEPAKG